MNGNITRLTALALILFATLSTASAKRLLLPPPEDYKGVEVNGIKLVVGQVYIPEFADTVRLKDYGFRAFEAMGSSSYYKKVKAVWRLDTDLKALPDWIVGLTYEKARSVQEIERAYKDSEDAAAPERMAGFVNYGYYFNNSGYYSSTTINYYSPGLSRGNTTGAPYCSWENDFNPEAYRYRTTTRTNLGPTTIGSYPDNKFLKRKCDCHGTCIHRGRSFR